MMCVIVVLSLSLHVPIAKPAATPVANPSARFRQVPLLLPRITAA